MRTSSHAPFYDLFKLIVVIILLIIFLALIWTRPGASSQPLTDIQTLTPLPPTPTVVSPPQTPVPPTATPAPSETPTQIPTATSPPTAVPTDEPLPTPIVEIPSEPEDCAAYSRSQLQVVIQRRLNFRSYPGLFNNLILTNNPGTEVEVIGGPACTRYQKGGAYLWWEIQLPDGSTGWSAEASAFGAFYFMEPK